MKIDSRSVFKYTVLLTVLAMLISIFPGQVAKAQSTVLTFKPDADAYVFQTYPTWNYGIQTTLNVDNSPLTNSYLRFTVSGLNGSAVQSAKLRLYAKTASTTGYDVRALSNNSWTETGINLSNAPTPGAVINKSAPFAGSTWTEVDVTSYVKADGTYNFVLTTTNNINTKLASRESSNPPQLVVTSATSATATQVTPPTSTLAPTQVSTSQVVPTSTPVIPTATATRTNPPVTPTATAMRTNTPVAPTATITNTPGQPTATITNTPIIPTATKTPTAGGGRTPVDYYVSTTGSDSNPGSITQPFKTIQKAADLSLGGDTIYIRGGTYNQRPVMFYHSNPSGPYITFTNYPGETVILDGTGIAVQYGEGLFKIWQSDYIRVSGLKIQHSNGAGIYAGYSNNIEVDNNFTYDTVKSGIGIWDCTNVVVDGNDIALAANSHPNYPMSEENISVDNSANFEIKNNYVHQAANIPDGGSGGEGINVKDGSSYGKVHNNVVHLDERSDGKPSNRLAFGLDAWNNANGTHDIEYYDNVAYNSFVGFIISSEQGGPVANIKVYNNIAYNNITGGFAIPWWSGTKDGMKTNIQFFNNTSYHNGYGFQSTSPLNSGVVVYNNIFSQNTVPVQLLAGSQSQFNFDHNLFDGPGGTYGTNPVIGAPQFVNPGSADFHLQSGSPAIDAGSSSNDPTNDYAGTSRPRGAGCDIGAYEY